MLAVGLTALGQWVFGSTAALLLAGTVVLSTGMLGLSAGLCAALTAVLALDFFFLPPIFSISMGREDWRAGLAFTVLAATTHLVERSVSSRIRREVKPPLGVHGSFDGIENGELYGWAFDADQPDHPVQVTLFANKHPIASVAAVHYRPDVAKTMTCSGRHGFYIDLAGHFKKDSDVWMDVRLPNGTSLAKSPSLLRVAAMAARPAKPTILFMHIPKTAGTAFREAMAVNFVQAEIAYLYPTPPGFLVSDLRELPLEQRRSYRAVIGHFQYGMHEALPQHSEYITIVRDPIARVLSQYLYLQEKQPELVHDRTGQLLSLPEILASRLTVDFDNAMTRCFSGVDQREFPPGSLNRSIYDVAVRNLRHNFSFVGHQEEADRALLDLQERYGWDKTRSLPAVNLGRKASGSRTTEEQMAVIRDYNVWDLLLYEEILLIYPLTPSRASIAVNPPTGNSVKHSKL